MNALTPYSSLAQPISEVLRKTMQKLRDVGLQVDQTFDLQVARSHHSGCLCPSHGTDLCSCQMVVLLVHCEGKGPVTLILHGSDGQTNLSIIDPSGEQQNIGLSAMVRGALAPQDIETTISAT